MSKPDKDSGENRSVDEERGKLSWGSPVTIAGILVLVGFGLLVVLLTAQVTADETTWTRLVFIYGSVEAVVFAAAGAIFGTQVQRSQTLRAESRAQDEQNRAERHADEAVRGRTLASVLKAERSASASLTSDLAFGTGADVSSEQSAGPVVDRLATLADELFPEA